MSRQRGQEQQGPKRRVHAVPDEPSQRVAASIALRGKRVPPKIGLAAWAGPGTNLRILIELDSLHEIHMAIQRQRVTAFLAVQQADALLVVRVIGPIIVVESPRVARAQAVRSEEHTSE